MSLQEAKLLCRSSRRCRGSGVVQIECRAGALPQSIIADYFPRALSCSTFHIALELDRAVFAREVYRPLLYTVPRRDLCWNPFRLRSFYPASSLLY